MEYVILKMCMGLLKNLEENKDKWMYYLYAINKLNSYSIYNINTYFKEFVEYILNKYNSKMDIEILIKNGKKFIEQNSFILKYEDQCLYDHKEIFTLKKTKQRTKIDIIYSSNWYWKNSYTNWIE